jgi:hypothetical protein
MPAPPEGKAHASRIGLSAARSVAESVQELLRDYSF